MNRGDISDSVICVGLACGRDLPDITYKKKTFKKGVPYGEMPEVDATRRPSPHEVEVYSFPQMWGSTALGFGGMGGSAMTTAQTTIVAHQRWAAIYFGQQFAYRAVVSQELMDDVRAHRLAACDEAEKYQGFSR